MWLKGQCHKFFNPPPTIFSLSKLINLSGVIDTAEWECLKKTKNIFKTLNINIILDLISWDQMSLNHEKTGWIFEFNFLFNLRSTYQWDCGVFEQVNTSAKFRPNAFLHFLSLPHFVLQCEVWLYCTVFCVTQHRVLCFLKISAKINLFTTTVQPVNLGHTVGGFKSWHKKCQHFCDTLF